MQRSTEGVKVWFWSRNDPTIPPEIASGRTTVVPSPGWGMPEAHFPPDSCEHSAHFDSHQIIFDTTLCVSRWR